MTRYPMFKLKVRITEPWWCSTKTEWERESAGGIQKRKLHYIYVCVCVDARQGVLVPCLLQNKTILKPVGNLT